MIYDDLLQEAFYQFRGSQVLCLGGAEVVIGDNSIGAARRC